MALLPGRDLGVAILWNSESSLPSGLLPTIIDRAIGLPAQRWLDVEPFDDGLFAERNGNGQRRRRRARRHRAATHRRQPPRRSDRRTRRDPRRKNHRPIKNPSPPGHAGRGSITALRGFLHHRHDGRRHRHRCRLAGRLAALLGCRLLGGLFRSALLGGLLRGLADSLLGSRLARRLLGSRLARRLLGSLADALLARQTCGPSSWQPCGRPSWRRSCASPSWQPCGRPSSRPVLRTAFLAALRTPFLAADLRTAFLAADLRAVFFVAFLADFFAAFFMAMGWLLVSGLAWLELPSSKRRRGSRTRDQPPTRKARRDGFGPAPGAATKNPRRRALRVRLEFGRLRFRRRKRNLHPPYDASGRRSVLCCALSCFSTHSLPQARSACGET